METSGGGGGQDFVYRHIPFAMPLRDRSEDV